MNNQRGFSSGERLGAIASFLPEIDQAQGAFGNWKGGERIESGSITMPYVVYSDIVVRFTESAYSFGWVKSEVNWAEWKETPEAIRLRDEPGAIVEATEEQLARLLTVVIRQDRFVEGALLSAFESGLISRIVKRIATLFDEQQGGEPSL